MDDTPSTFTMLKMMRRGLEPVFGADQAYQPSLWTDDAGTAIVAALRPTVPAGVYDVVDDESLTRRDLTRAIAEPIGQRWTLRLPMPVVRSRLTTGRACAFRIDASKTSATGSHECETHATV